MVSITGKPEVAVEVNSQVTVEMDGQIWGTGNDFYCPMVFTVWTDGLAEDKKQIVCGLGYDQSRGDIGQFKSNLAEAIKNAIDAEYEAGTDLSDVKVYCTWQWPFDSSKHSDNHSIGDGYGPILGSETSGHDDNEQDDAKDTALAGKMDSYSSNGGSPIEIKVTTTVTQID